MKELEGRRTVAGNKTQDRR